MIFSFVITDEDAWARAPLRFICHLSGVRRKGTSFLCPPTSNQAKPHLPWGGLVSIFPGPGTGCKQPCCIWSFKNPACLPSHNFLLNAAEKYVFGCDVFLLWSNEICMFPWMACFWPSAPCVSVSAATEVTFWVLIILK